MAAGDEITVNSRKYDHTISRSWKCTITEEDTRLFILKGEFDRDIEHEHLGLIRRGTISYEYYWRDRWYNVFKFHEPGGEFRNYYCNINMPPTISDGVLDYIDLDIDIIVGQDFSYKVLDLEEFRSNSVRFGYGVELCETVDRELAVLIKSIEQRDFPFDLRTRGM